MDDKQVGLLKRLREELSQKNAEPWENIARWTAKATPIIRKDWPNFFQDFQKISREPEWLCLPRAGGNDVFNSKARASEIATNKAKAEETKQLILNFLDGLLETYAPGKEETALGAVLFFCNRFPIFVRQLETRGHGRPPIKIADEYDVQYLLLSLLRLQFEDVRTEEWTPSYAGASSRMDFLLKREHIVIEVKKTRETLRDREVGEQLNNDIERYAKHQDCSALVCFVYDPDGFLDNPRGLEHDLTGKREDIEVIVVISPRVR